MSSHIELAEHVDQAHGALLEAMPADLLDLSDIPAARDRLRALFQALPQQVPAGIDMTEQFVPGFGDDPDVRVKIYRPTHVATRAPALLWIHGGGMVLMSADDDDEKCGQYAADHACIVVSVDYRLAPETPAPGLVHDCFAALQWLQTNSAELAVDPERIVIGGASAGAGLAAGLALFARDQGAPALAGQLLVFPMLDHRNVTDSSHAIDDARVWSRPANLAAWRAYLGDSEPDAYSAPGTAADLAGLAPAHISVGTLDLFLDEDIAYARSLNAAGVACELHVYPGAFHGSQNFLQDHELSLRWAASEAAFLARCFSR